MSGVVTTSVLSLINLFFTLRLSLPASATFTYLLSFDAAKVRRFFHPRNTFVSFFVGKGLFIDLRQEFVCAHNYFFPTFLVYLSVLQYLCTRYGRKH